MKKLLLVLGSISIIGCGEREGFRHPVVVLVDSAPIYKSADSTSDRVTVVAKGDTLELLNADAFGLCQVAPKSGSKRFAGSIASGFVKREHLLIPDSTLAAAKAKGFLTK